MSQLIHTLDSHIDLVHHDVPLFSYVYRPQTPAYESPRPYFHPLRTLGGRIVSGFRPNDHRWHHGLSMTCAQLSGHNFWGGATYLRGQGYTRLDNNGQQKAAGFLLQGDESGSGNGEIVHDVAWQTAAGEMILRERRAIEATIGEDFWELNFNLRFDNADNCSGQPVVWGSPTTQGRDNAGYGGLFWRGPRDFSGGQILMSEGRQGAKGEAAELMGQTSPWLAYIGRHDEVDAHSTLIFVDDSANVRHPTPWFVRNTTPMVCPYFAFGEEYKQAVGEVLELNYRIIIADGQWTREQIEAVV